MAAQRVVVIQDATRDISSSAIKWALDGLSLKPGDQLTLLGILHQVNNPSTFPFTGAGILLGYKIKVDSRSILGANQKIINEEVAKKQEEYKNSVEILQISKLYEIRKVVFHKKVVAASSPKVVALEAAKKLEATWIILDSYRQMKKDKKYFMERLSCGISRMKHNNNVEILRGPKAALNNTDGRRGSPVKYDEMLPGPERRKRIPEMTEETPEDDDLFSLELSPMKSKNAHENSSSDETRMNSEKGPSCSSIMMCSLSTATSSEDLSSVNTYSSSNWRNTEASSSSSFNEGKRSSPQLQEEENQVNIQTAEASGYSTHVTFDGQDTDWAKIYDNRNQESEQKHIHISEEAASRIGFPEKQLQEQLENSVCSYCKNGRPKIGWTDFTYTELQAATDNFSTENFLCEGGFGSVYKGKLKSGQWIAVKQHKHASLQGEKEFMSEVQVLNKARHKNVVMLLGSCSEESHLLLVYEFICNGSLDKHLSERSRSILSWRNRIKIALGAASGLNYLHQNNIIHRDMRPSNILVTHAYEALIGDFGLARTKHDESDCSSEKKIVGTFGYFAPEYAESGKVSTKADVYSFGVVLLELITGQRTINNTPWEKGLVEWAMPLLKERKYPELIDKKIQDSYDVHQLFWMVLVAEKCLSKDPDKRLSMEQVERALKCIMNGESVSVSGLEDFSPTRTSVSSVPKSNESQSEQGTPTKEEESLSSIMTLSEAFTTASSAQSPSRSLSTSTSIRNTFSRSGKNSRKKSPKSRIQQQVLYDEMLS